MSAKSDSIPKLGDVKFCSQCANYIAPTTATADKPADYARCRKNESLDVVTGEKFFVPCHPMRYEQGAPCGIDARQFEPKLIG
jgi:hypothetical protein